MVIFPKIPTRFHYSGDVAKAKELIGLGKKRLADLDTAMGFQGLDSASNGLRLSTGATVKTISSYGITNVYIYYPEVEEEAKEKKEGGTVLFYYRITNDGYTDDPAVYYEELEIDRLILWEMSLGDGPEFTPEVGDINYSGDFTPGEGQVILDVDVQNEIVYPEDPERTEDEEIALIAKANKYIEAIEADELPEISDTMFESGEVSNLTAAYGQIVAPVDRPHDYVSLQINEAWEDANGFGYDYWCMIPPYPTVSAEQTEWDNRYDPDDGGDPAQDYLDNLWPGFIADITDYYGDFYGDFLYRAYPSVAGSFAVAGDGPKYYVDYEHAPISGADGPEYLYGSWDYLGLFDLSDYQTDGGAQVTREIEKGHFYTGISGTNEYPPFFGFVYHLGADREFKVQEVGYDDTADIWFDSELGQFYFIGNSTISGINVSTKSNLHTPLESMTLVEITDTYGTYSGCNDTDCFDLGTDLAINYSWKNPSYGYYEQYLTHLPCDPTTVTWNEMQRSSTVYGETFENNVKVPNPDLVEQPLQSDFISFLSYLETSVETKAGYIGPSGSIYFCNGTTLSTTVWADVPETYSQSVGLVVYIFAPEYFEIELEPDSAPGVLTYWDIHTARYPDEEINPYRCLDLEEYLIDVLGTIKQAHRDSTVIPLYDSYEDDSIYTLEWYGYIQDHGFVNPV